MFEQISKLKKRYDRIFVYLASYSYVTTASSEPRGRAMMNLLCIEHDDNEDNEDDEDDDFVGRKVTGL